MLQAFCAAVVNSTTCRDCDAIQSAESATTAQRRAGCARTAPLSICACAVLQVFNDLWALSVGSEGKYQWENLTGTVQGTGPNPRFDHSAFIYPITPNSDTFDKLLIMGGRDLSAMLHDSFVLNLADMTWQSEAAPGLPFDVCNNVCDGIESVPYHKVFSFGGKKGMMQYMNTVEVMDCGSQVWSTPPIESGLAPCGR